MQLVQLIQLIQLIHIIYGGRWGAKTKRSNEYHLKSNHIYIYTYVHVHINTDRYAQNDFYIIPPSWGKKV